MCRTDSETDKSNILSPEMKVKEGKSTEYFQKKLLQDIFQK